jgi:hypothetical protein
MYRTLIVLLLLATASHGYEDIEAFKTFTREKLTASDLNDSFTRNRSGINDVRGHYDDAGTIHTVAKMKSDSLDASTLGKIYVVAPLVSFSSNDSLDFHRANVEHLHPDTLSMGAIMVSTATCGSHAIGKTSIQPGGTFHVYGGPATVDAARGNPVRPGTIFRLESQYKAGGLDDYLDIFRATNWSIQPVDTSAATNSGATLALGPEGLRNLYIGKSDGLAGQTDIYHKLAVTRTIDGPIATFTNPLSTTQARTSSPGGILVDFSSANTGGTGRYFFKGEDKTQARVQIYATGDIFNENGTYGTLSDEAVKVDIVDAPSQLDSLRGVKVREYALIADASRKKHMGVVAQEIALIFPEIVEQVTWGDSAVWVKSDTGMVETSVPVKRYAVKTSQMTWRLVASVQELDARVDYLETMVQSMIGLIILIGGLVGVKIARDKNKLVELPPDPPARAEP